MASTTERPVGRDAVMAALTAAAARLIIEKGAHVSVRQIATEAGVNHGLVHQYFGTKQALVSAAFDTINQRASRELDEQGFPPADLAERHGGELARALARIQLDDLGNQFSSHPIVRSWRAALRSATPDRSDREIDEMVITAATLALGWAVFGDQLCRAMDVGDEDRRQFDNHIATAVADIGGLPDQPTGAGPNAATK